VNETIDSFDAETTPLEVTKVQTTPSEPPPKEVTPQKEDVALSEKTEPDTPKEKPEPASLLSKFRRSLANSSVMAPPTLFDEDRPFAEPNPPAAAEPETAPKHAPDLEANEFYDEEEDEYIVYDDASATTEGRPVTVAEFVSSRSEKMYGEGEPDPSPIEEEDATSKLERETSAVFNPIPRKRPPGITPWTGVKKSAVKPDDGDLESSTPKPASTPEQNQTEPFADQDDADAPKLKLGIKPNSPQSELSFGSAPRGRFEGEGPNIIDGEDLDLPPFLRKKKS
jgi:hypothetical protein